MGALPDWDAAMAEIDRLEAEATRLRAALAAAEAERERDREALRIAKKAAQDYCWERYKGREPLNLSTPAVFTSHEWQKIGERIDAECARLAGERGGG